MRKHHQSEANVFAADSQLQWRWLWFLSLIFPFLRRLFSGKSSCLKVIIHFLGSIFIPMWWKCLERTESSRRATNSSIFNAVMRITCSQPPSPRHSFPHFLSANFVLPRWFWFVCLLTRFNPLVSEHTAEKEKNHFPLASLFGSLGVKLAYAFRFQSFPLVSAQWRSENYKNMDSGEGKRKKMRKSNVFKSIFPDWGKESEGRENEIDFRWSSISDWMFPCISGRFLLLLLSDLLV